MSAAGIPALPTLNWIRTSTHHAETAVLIHAVGHDLTYWDRQIEALASSYNVVAFDLPGHGRSPGDSADWSFAYASSVTAQLIEETSSKPVHLIGISFGGMIAQVTALSRPDLVRSLTLIGTAASFGKDVQSGMRARAELVRTDGMAAVVESSLSRWFTATTRQNRPDIMDRLTKTLLADDPSTPPLVAKGLASSISEARLIEIPNCSHIVTVEAPNAVNEAVLSFLKQTDR